jgi:hypothetical protein
MSISSSESIPSPSSIQNSPNVSIHISPDVSTRRSATATSGGIRQIISNPRQLLFDPDGERGTLQPIIRDKQRTWLLFQFRKVWRWLSGSGIIGWKRYLPAATLLFLLFSLFITTNMLFHSFTTVPELPGPSPTGWCSTPSPAFHTWSTMQKELISRMKYDCSVELARMGMMSKNGPRILIATGGDPSAGFGDRLTKFAGMFLFAMLSGRSFFIREQSSDGLIISQWLGPTNAFSWESTGEVGECIERALTDPSYAHLIADHTHIDDSTWGIIGIWGIPERIRRFLLPHSMKAPEMWESKPIMLMEGSTNAVRSYTIEKEFRGQTYIPPCNFSAANPKFRCCLFIVLSVE